MRRKKPNKQHKAKRDLGALIAAPERLCRVCGRVMWGDPVPDGFGRERHKECEPGSEAWFEAMPRHKRTEEGKLLYDHARGKHAQG